MALKETQCLNPMRLQTYSHVNLNLCGILKIGSHCEDKLLVLYLSSKY